MTTFKKLPIVAPKTKPITHDQLGRKGSEVIIVGSITAQPAGYKIRQAAA